eukprot:11252605-Alexandrium_andersonii.AAC.3
MSKRRLTPWPRLVENTWNGCSKHATLVIFRVHTVSPPGRKYSSRQRSSSSSGAKASLAH